LSVQLWLFGKSVEENIEIPISKKHSRNSSVLPISEASFRALTSLLVANLAVIHLTAAAAGTELSPGEQSVYDQSWLFICLERIFPKQEQAASCMRFLKIMQEAS
jgi:hypothetical protein